MYLLFGILEHFKRYFTFPFFLTTLQKYRLQTSTNSVNGISNFPAAAACVTAAVVASATAEAVVASSTDAVVASATAAVVASGSMSPSKIQSQVVVSILAIYHWLVLFTIYSISKSYIIFQQSKIPSYES